MAHIHLPARDKYGDIEEAAGGGSEAPGQPVPHCSPSSCRLPSLEVEEMEDQGEEGGPPRGFLQAVWYVGGDSQYGTPNPGMLALPPPADPAWGLCPGMPPSFLASTRGH